MNDTQLARLITRASDFYNDATLVGSLADDFTKGQAWGELSQALRIARIAGGFAHNDSDAYIIGWSRRVLS